MIDNALIFIAASILLTGLSFILNRKKTLLGLKKGLLMFKNIAIPFLNILILISLTLYVMPAETITRYLGPGSGALGFTLAALIGSIALIPAFISYPIAASLIKQGASYGVVATFMTTLMMVGVITLPLEAKYFGWKISIMRNFLNFVAALIIGLIIGGILG